jgi:hypothetical protein
LGDNRFIARNSLGDLHFENRSDQVKVTGKMKPRSWIARGENHSEDGRVFHKIEKLLFDRLGPFDALDINKDGQISLEEYDSIWLDNAVVGKTIQALDKDGCDF